MIDANNKENPFCRLKNLKADAEDEWQNDFAKSCALFAKNGRVITLEVAQIVYKEAVVCNLDDFDMLDRCGLVACLWRTLLEPDDSIRISLVHVLLEFAKKFRSFGENVLANIETIMRILGRSELQVPLFEMLAFLIRQRPLLCETLHRHNLFNELSNLLANTQDMDVIEALSKMIHAMADAGFLLFEQPNSSIPDQYDFWCKVCKFLLQLKQESCQSCAVSMFACLSRAHIGSPDNLFDADSLIAISKLFGSFRYLDEMFKLFSWLCEFSEDYAVLFFDETTVLMSLKRFISTRDNAFRALSLVIKIACLPNYAEIISEYGFLPQMFEYYPNSPSREKEQLMKLFCIIGANHVTGITDCSFLGAVIIDCLDLITDSYDRDFVIFALRTVINLFAANIDLSAVREEVDMNEVMESIRFKADIDVASLATTVSDYLA